MFLTWLEGITGIRKGAGQAINSWARLLVGIGLFSFEESITSHLILLNF